MVPNKKLYFHVPIYFSGFACCCVGRQTVDLPFCSKPGLFINHKLRGSFLALPASHYLRDFLSLALSVILGCMFLSQGMESAMLLSRVQQKREKERSLGNEIFWRVVLVLCQGLNRQYETWDFQLSHGNIRGFLWDISFLLCHGECMGSVEICLRSAAGEMWWNSQQLPVCLPESPVCIVKLQQQLGQTAWVCGFPAISVSYRSPRDLPPGAEPRVWSRGAECCLEKTGTMLVFTDWMRICFIFPQAGHGSKNPCVKGKMVFSQGVWAPCDHLHHQRLFVQDVSSWHFVLLLAQ